MATNNIIPRLAQEPAFPDGVTSFGMTYREYLIAQIAAGTMNAMYGHGAYAELIAPQVIKLADEIIKALEKENAEKK